MQFLAEQRRKIFMTLVEPTSNRLQSCFCFTCLVSR